ncbi:uncharacterized protein [Diadema antillarum]|uniref:uncharacterized protein n=1 Tax=Diadema antillarum TaxID=105358 RepID=UPI003A8A2AFF
MVIEIVFLNIATGDNEKGRIESALGHKGIKAQRIFKDFMIRNLYRGDDIGGKTATNLMMTTSQLNHSGSGLPSTTSANRDVNESQFFIATVETSWLNIVE